MTTHLSVIGLPGKPHTFTAKTPEVGGKGAGPFTSLSVTATPGARHSFVAKTPSVGGKGAGPFTALSVIGVPGRRHSFTAKTPYVPPVVIPPVETLGGGGSIFTIRPDYDQQKKFELRQRLLREDEELLEIISTILPYL